VLNNLFINALLLLTFTLIIGHVLKDVPQKIVNSMYGKIADIVSRVPALILVSYQESKGKAIVPLHFSAIHYGFLLK
jgi:hypothetical protein